MRTKKGTITSTKMQNTVVVTVHSYKNDPIYKKNYRVSKKYYADTAGKEYNEGDLVLISEIKPMSKLKRWKVEEVMELAVAA